MPSYHTLHSQPRCTPSLPLFLLRTGMLAGLLGLLSNKALAVPNGQWSASVSCSARTDVMPVRPAFKYDLPAVTISNQTFTLQHSVKEPNNTVTEQWQGQVASGQWVVTAKGQRDNGNTWFYEFKLPDTNANSINLQGAMVADGKTIRTCNLGMNLQKAEATAAPAAGGKPTAAPATTSAAPKASLNDVKVPIEETSVDR